MVETNEQELHVARAGYIEFPKIENMLCEWSEGNKY